MICVCHDVIRGKKQALSACLSEILSQIGCAAAAVKHPCLHSSGPPAVLCAGLYSYQQFNKRMGVGKKITEWSHASSFLLQPGVVRSGHGVPGIHISVHTHGNTFLWKKGEEMYSLKKKKTIGKENKIM